VLANHLEPPCTDPYARWCGRDSGTAAPMRSNGILGMWALVRSTLRESARRDEGGQLSIFQYRIPLMEGHVDLTTPIPCRHYGLHPNGAF